MTTITLTQPEICPVNLLPSETLPPNRLTVLVAEDDPDQSDALRDVLEYEGYVVRTEFSGDGALRQLNTGNFHAAIMDARMPGMHGGDVLKACKNQIGRASCRERV